MFKSTAIIAVLFTAVLSISCSGIDGSGVDRGPSSTPSPQITEGAIESFEPLTVNEIVFDTENTEFFVNEQPAIEGDLALKQIVVVDGDVDETTKTGTANTITYLSSVQGIVQFINLENRNLTVLGQTFLTRDETRIIQRDLEEIMTLEDLNVGDYIEISAWPLQEDDPVRSASWIGVTEDTSIRSVTDVVSDIDYDEEELTINGLTVDFSLLAITDTINEGDLVRVQGILIPGRNNYLLADNLTLIE